MPFSVLNGREGQTVVLVCIIIDRADIYVKVVQLFRIIRGNSVLENKILTRDRAAVIGIDVDHVIAVLGISSVDPYEIQAFLVHHIKSADALHVYAVISESIGGIKYLYAYILLVSSSRVIFKGSYCNRKR